MHSCIPLSITSSATSPARLTQQRCSSHGDGGIDLSTSHRRLSGRSGGRLTSRRLIPSRTHAARPPKQAMHLDQPCPGPLPAAVPSDLGPDSERGLLNQSAPARDGAGCHVASATPGGASRCLGPGTRTPSRVPSHRTIYRDCVWPGGAGLLELEQTDLRHLGGTGLRERPCTQPARRHGGGNAAMVGCCAHWSHGDGAEPPLATRRRTSAGATAASPTGLVAGRVRMQSGCRVGADWCRLVQTGAD
ncbi:hypothetical protein K505DRAFT_380416 [Melanomma pulvis-pyrius CBS 109.77]|uniref:Uncharacterized protein n=1 Tax=Melanomma pulvis-pyrius CBS 109.77 TaxID=1314802 RepID=A0A6A6WQ58_9PLEO|nr:hypothetical protein K505DRAFT_380416 [Melanomma pulvis-pyrius CBS 109.77]